MCTSERDSKYSESCSQVEQCSGQIAAHAAVRRASAMRCMIQPEIDSSSQTDVWGPSLIGDGNLFALMRLYTSLRLKPVRESTVGSLMRLVGLVWLDIGRVNSSRRALSAVRTR